MSTRKADVRVTVSKNGPYVVTGDVPLATHTIVADTAGGSESWHEGAALPHSETYALCRCGASKNKPFCDGSHAKIEFNGAEAASRNTYASQARTLDGEKLSLTDAEALCAFARFCDPNGQVWNQVRRTDDPSVARTFLNQVQNCPSGRLVAWDRATGEVVESELPISIGLVEDPQEKCSGPLWLRGGIPVIAADGFHYEIRNRVTLCRCGASANKPFCDGTHAKIKFTAG